MIIDGKVKRVRFYNENSSWGVILVDYKDFSGHWKDIACVGPMQPLYEGQRVLVDGDIVEDPQFGEQIKINSLSAPEPKTVDGMAAYLATLVKGVGEKTAERIVAHFGDDTLNVFNNDRKRLSELDFMSEDKRRELADQWLANRNRAGMKSWLLSTGLTNHMSNTIIEKYGDQSRALLEENPYRLAWDVHGIGFKRADQVARKIGFDMESMKRLAAACHYALKELAGEGHVYATQGMLTEKVAEYFASVDSLLIGHAITSGVTDGYLRRDIHNSTVRVYLTHLYEAEVSVAESIERLNQVLAIATVKDFMPEPVAGDITLTAQQEVAMRSAFFHPVSVITGGPGTGKTTLVQQIVHNARAAGINFHLCAPTGRAAKRLSEATGERALTIHKTLGAMGAGVTCEQMGKCLLDREDCEPNDRNGCLLDIRRRTARQRGGFTFTLGKDMPLETDLLIVDESSMVDIELAARLLEAVKTGCHVVFVGDIDQLPSVGAGNFLRDVILSGVASVTTLNTIHRQDSGSLIVPNAHAINRGELPDVSNAGADFFWFEINDPTRAQNQLVDLATKRIPARFGVNAFEDVQVLAPMYKSKVGIDALNQRMKEALNPGCAKIDGMEVGKYNFHAGDKVIQTRNNYDIGIMNGDIGWIDAVTNKFLTVTFDGNTVEIPKKDAFSLRHAFCISVHKSQGAEFPIIVMPVSTSHWIMMQRNLIYTGVTRAKVAVILVGQNRALRQAVRNDNVSIRKTALVERLKACKMDASAYAMQEKEVVSDI